jgi:hypothetical protein
VVDDIVEPASTARPRRQYTVTEALGKNAPTTRGCIAVEATRHNDKPNRTPRQRQISQAPKILTVDTLGARSAPWTRARPATVPDRNHGHGAITYGAHDLKAWRDQG